MLEGLCSQLRKELQNSSKIRRIRVNPYFYHKLSVTIDQNYYDIYGLTIIEDSSIETYKIEY